MRRNCKNTIHGGIILSINILKEPRDKEYERLIQYAFKTCKTFVLAVQREILIFYPKPKILEELEQYKVNGLKALYYPQINYYNHDTILYFYECNEGAKSIIMQAVMGLYDWRHPYLPEDLTFLDDKGDIWMYSISHENIAGIYERNIDEVEFIKSEIELEIYWRERVYTEAEAMEAITNLHCLIDGYFFLLRANETWTLDERFSNKENSEHYMYWNEYFDEYDIKEHYLAFEIAHLGNLLKLNNPIYAFDFSNLLNEVQNTSYLEQSLIRNIGGNSEILYEFLERFKLKYKKK